MRWDWLDTEVRLSTLVFYCGLLVGLGLLVAAEFTADYLDLGSWGLAVLGLSCTYLLNCRIAARDDRLAEAFNLGRDHALSSVKSR